MRFVVKPTRLERYLSDASRAGGLDGVRFVPRFPRPDDDWHHRRLSCVVTRKSTYDAASVAQVLQTVFQDALIFCDTSVFDHRTDERVWDALLDRHDSVILLPDVHRELEPWLTRNSDHPAARAVNREHPAFRFHRYGQLSEWEISSLTYYVNLLSMRKRIIQLKMLQFESDNGRVPVELEVKQMKQNLHRSLGPRGYHLAAKDLERNLQRMNYTDEFLVCAAAMSAITVGRPTVILSKDEDVLEQFYKLQWLLDTHYRGMLLGDLYAQDPFQFSLRLLPNNTDQADNNIYEASAILVDRSREFLDEILPDHWSPVPVYCLIAGEYFSMATFLAERGQAQLLRVKGETGGLNTKQLNGRNCHIWLVPLGVPYHLRSCALVAHDRRVNLRFAPVSIPMIDIHQTIYCGENFLRPIEYNSDLIHLPSTNYFIDRSA
jgi:hypothetical protein